MPVLKIVQTFLENIVGSYIYHLAKFLGLMIYDSKDMYYLMYYLYVLSYVLSRVLCTHHDVTDLEIQGMLKNAKT